jgi:hypothetical protein
VSSATSRKKKKVEASLYKRDGISNPYSALYPHDAGARAKTTPSFFALGIDKPIQSNSLDETEPYKLQAFYQTPNPMLKTDARRIISPSIIYSPSCLFLFPLHCSSPLQGEAAVR